MYEFGINKYKLIIKNHPFAINEMKRILYKYIHNIEDSEYCEQQSTYKLLLNDQPLDKKSFHFFEINDIYSFESESKLSSKTLLHKYYELEFNKSKYFDTINTINILLNSLCKEINLDKKFIRTDIKEFNTNFLLKICEPHIEMEGYNCNEVDLNIENSVKMQLKLLKQLEKDPTIQQLIIVLDTDSLSKEILTFMNSFQKTLFIIFTNTIINLNLINIYYLSDIAIDLANDEEIYEKICQCSYSTYSLKEAKKAMKQYLNKRNKTHTDRLSHIIK